MGSALSSLYLFCLKSDRQKRCESSQKRCENRIFLSFLYLSICQYWYSIVCTNVFQVILPYLFGSTWWRIWYPTPVTWLIFEKVFWYEYAFILDVELWIWWPMWQDMDVALPMSKVGSKMYVISIPIWSVQSILPVQHWYLQSEIRLS
jgi:hypothetical protein